MTLNLMISANSSLIKEDHYIGSVCIDPHLTFVGLHKIFKQVKTP